VVKQGRRGDPRTLALFLATQGRDLAEAVRLAEEERRTRGDLYTRDALAWALHKAGRHAEARTEIDAALRHGTKDARLFWHAGAIRVAAGDVEGGRRFLRDALALNPKFDPAGAADAQRLLK
jgi:tetratricopeptide (TPR) repeat protein